jgi:hypothetical protein
VSLGEKIVSKCEKKMCPLKSQESNFHVYNLGVIMVIYTGKFPALFWLVISVEGTFLFFKSWEVILNLGCTWEFP